MHALTGLAWWSALVLRGGRHAPPTARILVPVTTAWHCHATAARSAITGIYAAQKARAAISPDSA
ncbi:MAG: hypothetical protein WAK71_05840 [Streptosporangiaceae bacterium]